MFPESLSELAAYEMGGDQPYDLGQSNNVQRLAEPSQVLKTAVVNLINYQDDAELATKAIPELIKLLSDKDKVVVSHAAAMVHQLSKRDTARQALAAHEGMMPALMKAMEKTKDPQITEHAMGAVSNISSHPDGLLAIFRSGGIPALVRMLRLDCLI